MTVGVAVDLDHPDGPRMPFGRDGVWTRPPPTSARACASGGSLMPAISCRSDCKLQLNFGATIQPRLCPSFLPVHCQLTGVRRRRGSRGGSGLRDAAASAALALLAALRARGCRCRTEVVALLTSQLRITGELLKMEAAKIGDEPLDEMVALSSAT